jgi:hypothetical protein
LLSLQSSATPSTSTTRKKTASRTLKSTSPSSMSSLEFEQVRCR